MKLANKSLLLVLAAAAILSLSGCAGSGCPNLNLGSTGGAGGTTGGVSKSGPCGGAAAAGGGGGGIGAGGASALVYQLPTSTSVGALGLGGNGSLSVISPFTSPAITGSGADDMLIVNGKFLYIPQSSTSNVEAFVINRNTAGLTAIPGSPIPVATGADTIASDPKGRFLFVGLEGGAGLAAFQIDPTTGALKPTTNSPFTFPISSVDVLTVDGNGKFLYVGEQGSIVHGFLIDQNTGDLSPMQLGGAPFTLNVATPRADSSGKFLLGVAGFADEGSATDAHIHVFAIDQTTGVPTEIAGSPFPTTTPPLDFAISPNGKFVYTFGTTSSSTSAPVEGFSIDPTTGALTPLTGSPFTTLPGAGPCKFEPSGGNMICPDSYGGSKFMVFAANPTTGALTHTGTDVSNVSTLPFAVTN